MTGSREEDGDGGVSEVGKKKAGAKGRRDFTQKEEKEMKKNEIGKRNGPPDFL